MKRRIAVRKQDAEYAICFCCIWITKYGCGDLTSPWRFCVCELELVFVFVHGVFSFQVTHVFVEAR